MKRTVILSENASKAIYGLREADFSDPVKLVEGFGYDPKTFFRYHTFKGIDFRESDITGLDFNNAVFKECYFYDDQAEAVEKNGGQRLGGLVYVRGSVVMSKDQFEIPAPAKSSLGEVKPKIEEPIAVKRSDNTILERATISSLGHHGNTMANGRSIDFSSQNAMRHMRKIAIQRGVVAILDLGSTKISSLVLRFDDGDTLSDEGVIGSLAGQSGFRIVGAATTRSRGVCFGEITGMGETERAIRTALQAAQKMAGIRVDHVIACFSGGQPRSYGLDAEIELYGRTVTEDDVARVLSECDMPEYGENRAVLHAQPVNFAIDYQSGLSDPRGQKGQSLSVDMHMLTVDAEAVQQLVHSVKRCDLELAGIASSAYASGISTLVEDEQELGAACIDMGGGATGVSIFLKKHMIYADTVRMGGDHVTQDISHGLQVPTANAERIKLFYGGVHATGMDDREMIEIGGEIGDYAHEPRTASRKELIGIMRPRLEEIFEEVRGRLDAAGFDHLPNQQIVLTGGGSQIPGLDGLASKILGQQVRLGRPLRVHGLPNAAMGPGFSSVVGLALIAAHPHDEWWDFEDPVKFMGQSVNWATRNL